MNTAPVGRKEVNVSVSDECGDVMKKAIETELRRGGQVFVVVPFVADVTPTHHRWVEKRIDVNPLFNQQLHSCW